MKGVSDLCPHLDLTPGHELSSSIVLWLYSSSSHWMVKYSDSLRPRIACITLAGFHVVAFFVSVLVTVDSP